MLPPKVEQVVLVDHAGEEIGTEEKLTAHQKGLLHRAFSVFVFNSKGEVLLQRRANNKYHSGGLWSNACCSHPRPGETVLEAAHRRLQEEMGFDCELKEVFTFTYKTPVSKDLIEHEFDHVLIGKYDGDPKLNPEEADDWCFEDPSALLQKLESSPNRYTYWLKISFPRVLGATKD